MKMSLKMSTQRLEEEKDVVSTEIKEGEVNIIVFLFEA